MNVEKAKNSFLEARLGELIKQEQHAGRLIPSKGGRPSENPDNDVRVLKDYGLTRQDSSRAQKIFVHQDLIPVVVAKAEERTKAEAGRLASQSKGPTQFGPNNVVRPAKTLKDYGLTWQDSSRAQRVAEHQDLIPVVVAKPGRRQKK